MSPTGDFLATAHVNYLGIFLWANKTLFSHVALHAIPPDSEAPLVDLPTTVSNDDMKDIIDDIDQLNIYEKGEKLDSEYHSPIQLNEHLITMSTLAASRWQNLLNLDIIKKHNKPKIGVKKPKQAPFFLPTLSGPELKFDLSQNANEIDTESKILMPNNFSNFTKFGKMLNDNKKTENYQQCIDHIITLGPSMIDFEIKSLSPDGGGSNEIMLKFMKMIAFMLSTNLNFELAQTYLAVFLKSHSRLIIDNIQLRNYLKELQQIQISSWQTLEKQLLYGLGVANNLRNVTN